MESFLSIWITFDIKTYSPGLLVTKRGEWFFFFNTFRRSDSRYSWTAVRSSIVPELKNSITTTDRRVPDLIRVVCCCTLRPLFWCSSNRSWNSKPSSITFICRHVCPFRISTGQNKSTNCAHRPFEIDCKATLMCKHLRASRAIIYIIRFETQSKKKSVRVKHFFVEMTDRPDLSCDTIRFFADEYNPLCESDQRFPRVLCGGQLQADEQVL